MNRTELRAALDSLVTQLLGQPELPRTRDEAIDYLLDVRDAVDDIRDGLADLDDAAATELAAFEVVTKRCARRACGAWMRVADTGRERAYCGDACRQAARRERIR